MSVSHGSRGHPAELTPLSLIRTRASQSLDLDHDLRLRRHDVGGNAHAISGSEAAGPHVLNVAEAQVVGGAGRRRKRSRRPPSY